MKRKLLKQAAALLVLASAIYIIRLPDGWLDKKAYALIEKPLKKNDIAYEFESYRFRYPLRFSLYDGGMIIPAGKIPIPFAFNEAHIKVKTLSLLLLKFAAELKIFAYDGMILGTVERSLLGERVKANLLVEEIAVERYPIGQHYSIAGQLNSNTDVILSREPRTPEDVEEVSSTIRFSNGSYTGKHQVYGIYTIPDVNDIEANIQVVQNQLNVTINEATLTSSVGNAEGGGSIDLTVDGKIEKGSIEGILNLSDAGHKAFGGFIALRAGQPVDTPVKDWVIKLALEYNRVTSFTIEPSR